MDYFAFLGLLIFIVLLLSLSIFLALKTQRKFLSAILSTLIATFSVQLISYFHLGHLDPFFEIAFFVSIALGFPIALTTSFLTLRGRPHKTDAPDKTSN